MSSAPDYYMIMGVAPDADSESIRIAYRNMARRLHPDVNHNPGAATQFRDVTSAYAVLNDPIERQKYDVLTRRPSVPKRRQMALLLGRLLAALR